VVFEAGGKEVVLHYPQLFSWNPGRGVLRMTIDSHPVELMEDRFEAEHPALMAVPTRISRGAGHH
jgi:hypothetical protein